jgi:hypothetical protein
VSALTRTDLDQIGCSEPGCTENHDVLFMHPTCCLTAEGAEVRYEKLTGELIITCNTCDGEMCRISVAP